MELLLHLFGGYIGIGILFFFVALVYSSVGFGGGSSYLAILSLLGLPYTHIRSIALICNISVVSGNVMAFKKKGLIDWRQFLPFVIAGIPLSFIGGLWPIKKQVFFILLGISLVIAAIFLFFQSNKHIQSPSHGIKKPLLNVLLGGTIGFLSGLVGIGGGVFLSPILHLMRWDTPRKIAALSSLFILFNSVSGLAGQWMHPQFTLPMGEILGLILAVAAGSAVGRHMSFKHFTPQIIRRVTGILVGFVGLRILWDQVFHTL